MCKLVGDESHVLHEIDAVAEHGGLLDLRLLRREWDLVHRLRSNRKVLGKRGPVYCIHEFFEVAESDVNGKRRRAAADQGLHDSVQPGNGMRGNLEQAVQIVHAVEAGKHFQLAAVVCDQRLARRMVEAADKCAWNEVEIG